MRPTLFAGFAIFASALLASCLTTPDVESMQIELEEDAEVTEEVWDEGPSPRELLHVISYLSPSHGPVAANLFLVSTIVEGDNAELIVRRRHLVVDIWRMFPFKGYKECHQWTIWEDTPGAPANRAEFQLLVEDMGNRLLAEKRVPIDLDSLERMRGFYARVKAFLIRKVGAPGQIIDRISLDIRSRYRSIMSPFTVFGQ